MIPVIRVQKKKILLVEDEEMYLEIVADILRGHNYEVVTAVNGLIAQQILENEYFDIVLSDVQMPKVDGIALLTHVREMDPHFPPMIIMTGFSVHELSDIENRGAFAIIEKPFAAQTLMALIERALESSSN